MKAVLLGANRWAVIWCGQILMRDLPSREIAQFHIDNLLAALKG